MIPPHLVKEIREIELRTGRRIRSHRIGASRSTLRGDGFDFDQHRPYREGDDVRRIDWNATARVGAPFLRQTRTDRELQAVFALDLSTSMQFGSAARSKHEALVLTTATLLFSALAQRLRVGVVGFAGNVLDWTAPVSDPSSAWAALTRAWALRSEGKATRLQPAVAHLLRMLKRTTLVALVSDFQVDDDPAQIPELSVLATRHDVVAVVVDDPVELTLPAGAGFVRLRDVERRSEVTVALTAATRRLFEQEWRQRRADLRTAFYRCGVEPAFVNAQGDVTEPVMRLFEGRRG